MNFSDQDLENCFFQQDQQSIFLEEIQDIPDYKEIKVESIKKKVRKSKPEKPKRKSTIQKSTNQKHECLNQSSLLYQNNGQEAFGQLIQNRTIQLKDKTLFLLSLKTLTTCISIDFFIILFNFLQSQTRNSSFFYTVYIYHIVKEYKKRSFFSFTMPFILQYKLVSEDILLKIILQNMNDLDGTQNQDQAILTIPKSTAVALTGDTECIQEQELSLYFQNENKSFEQLNDPSEDDFKSHIKSLSKAIFARQKWISGILSGHESAIFLRNSFF
ncbi:hypothetical protein pb186bvf_006280 [Paramecium bursaria]